MKIKKTTLSIINFLLKEVGVFDGTLPLEKLKIPLSFADKILKKLKKEECISEYKIVDKKNVIVTGVNTVQLYRFKLYLCEDVRDPIIDPPILKSIANRIEEVTLCDLNRIELIFSNFCRTPDTLLHLYIPAWKSVFDILEVLAISEHEKDHKFLHRIILEFCKPETYLGENQKDVAEETKQLFNIYLERNLLRIKKGKIVGIIPPEPKYIDYNGLRFDLQNQKYWAINNVGSNKPSFKRHPKKGDDNLTLQGVFIEILKMDGEKFHDDSIFSRLSENETGNPNSAKIRTYKELYDAIQKNVICRKFKISGRDDYKNWLEYHGEEEGISLRAEAP